MAYQWVTLFCVTATVMSVYAVPFLFASQARSLRLIRLMVLLLVVMCAGRVVIASAGFAESNFASNWVGDIGLLAVAVVALAARRQIERVWLLRIAMADLQTQIESACKGLFLRNDFQHNVSLTRTRVVFQIKGESAVLRTRRIGAKLQFVVLPPDNVHGKITLLTRWLAKQFPGPIPKVKFVLSKKGTSDV